MRSDALFWCYLKTATVYSHITINKSLKKKKVKIIFGSLFFAYQRRLEISRDIKRQVTEPWTQNDHGELKTKKEPFLLKELLDLDMMAYTFIPNT